jgi:signal transduction histidine kinase
VSGHETTERIRRRLPLAVLLLVAIVLVDVVFSKRASMPGCWLMPNRYALHIPFLDACAEHAANTAAAAPDSIALRARDFVRATSGAALLLFVPLVLFVRTTTAAASPLLIFYGCLATLVSGVLGGRSSWIASYAGLVALCIAPAALFHLSFVLPKRRGILELIPQITRVPYLCAAPLFVVGLYALDSKPLLWTPLVSLLGAIAASGWAILMLSCWYAIRESRSRFERARARFVLCGGVLLPVAPTALHGVVALDVSRVIAVYFWSGAVLLQLSIALAIARHNLFDIATDVRLVLARGIHVAFASAVLIAVFGAMFGSISFGPHHNAEIFLGAVAAALVLTALQPRYGAALESVFIPELERLRVRRLKFERELDGCADAGIAVDCALRCIREVLDPRGVAVLSRDTRGFRVVAALDAGDKLRPDVAEEALRALGDQDSRSLALASEAELDAFPELSECDVELIVRLRSLRGELGLLLVGARPNESPYRGFEIAFVDAIAAQTGAVLAHIELRQELLRKERAATTGRIAIGIAHDMGKELDWLSWLVARLPERLDQPGKLARDIALVGKFTKDVVEGLRGFIHDALRESAAPSPLCAAREVIELAVARAVRLHGDDRIALTFDDSIRALRLHEDVQRAILNLLDNALRASPLSSLVRLSAKRVDDQIEIAIEDRGNGIPDELLANVLEAGFTTRAAEGGTGVGLAVASEIAASHGGRVEIAPHPRAGTRAVISLPVIESDPL